MKRITYAVAMLLAVSLTISCSKSEDVMSQQDRSAIQANTERQNISERAGDRIIFTQVVQLEGSQEVPSVDTETKGIAILRISESLMLYSKVIIQNLAPGDVLRFAHIHEGAVGVSGPVRVTLAATAADFGVNKEIQLTQAQYNLILSGNTYVNAHSNFFPPGIVRGQIMP